MLIPVILSGGSGTRLWPLSTPARPKQFLPLVSRRTLFQETLERLQGLPGLSPPIIVCNEAHRFLVAEQLREIGVDAGAIVLEPAGRNTAPAIAVAALIASGRAPGAAQGSEPVFAAAKEGSDPILLVLPADHVIADAAAFRAAVLRAVEAAGAGRLVTFGIVPTHAETGYGYIEQGGGQGAWRAVARFVEKPDHATAEAYLATGRFLWNSGMFVFGAGPLLAGLRTHAPAICAACESAAAVASSDTDFVRLGAGFLDSPSDSIDYALMEKTDRAAVVPLDAGWSDVGSWAALYDALPKDAAGNVVHGDVVALDARNNLVISDSRKVALLGVDDLVVIDAGDTLLILDRQHSQRVKAIQQKVTADSS